MDCNVYPHGTHQLWPYTNCRKSHNRRALVGDTKISGTCRGRARQQRDAVGLLSYGRSPHVPTNATAVEPANAFLTANFVARYSYSSTGHPTARISEYLVTSHTHYNRALLHRKAREACRELSTLEFASFNGVRY